MHAVFPAPVPRDQRRTECRAGHPTHPLTAVGLATRGLWVVVLVTMAVRVCTSWAMLPVAWTLVSIAAAAVVTALFQASYDAAGLCVDCEHEAAFAAI